jgi:hypothetical protein
VLLGRDLSIGGMRVEYHENVQIGDVLELAVYVSPREEPIILKARVAHDAGDGLGLSFEGMPAEVGSRLEKLIARLPSVESLQGGEPPASAASCRASSRAFGARTDASPARSRRTDSGQGCSCASASRPARRVARRSTALALHRPVGQNAARKTCAASWLPLVHQRWPCTVTTATASFGLSAGATPANHS